MLKEEKLFIEINKKEFRVSDIKEYGIVHGVIEVDVDDEACDKELGIFVKNWKNLFLVMVGHDASVKPKNKKTIKKKTTYVYIATHSGDLYRFTSDEGQMSRWVCTLRKEIGKRSVMKERI